MFDIRNYFFNFLIFIIISGQCLVCLSAQEVYKTPTGNKYHLATCRMVENVSAKVGKEDINKLQLTPCKICKPPVPNNLIGSFSGVGKAVGTDSGTKCKGLTKEGTSCNHYTKLANGYCYQHTYQNSSTSKKSGENPITIVSTQCGAKTKSGYCKRKVKGGGRCYQHS